MLNTDVLRDYQNDWIKRCSNLKCVDYSSLNNHSVFCIADNNSIAFSAMSDIFDIIAKKHGITVRSSRNICDDDMLLLWDMTDFPLTEKQLDIIKQKENRTIVVTDKTDSIISGMGITLFCGLLYGAGFNDTEPVENDYTNILDFLAAQLYLICKYDSLKKNSVYYAGHGKCTKLKAEYLQDMGYEPMISFCDGNFMTQFSKARPDELFYFDNTYGGNLKLLHELLLKCLLEFDRICKKHDIKYFLGGGTLLGAIRHKGMIPWDDDMDVMMLRDDYEKFLSVVENELCDDMFFQSSKTDSEYHSLFTKIRLNGTAFVTQYSQQFENMHQGIFIDIFVHDHTSDNKLGQKLHVFKTLFARSMVFHKWAKTPMHFYGKLKLVCKLATRYINKTSISKLEEIQDRVVKKYNSKNTNHLYDGTGEHLRHGAFPSSWLDEVEYADFMGHKLPVPKEYDNYLKYSYGNYMELIPASLRKAGHDIVKVDFGKYIKQDK